jgi:deazaflavin-dependent oxidoreductase (nitroreductase family)
MMKIAERIPKPDFMEEAEWDLLMKTRAPEIIRLGARAHVQTYLETNGGGDTYLTQGAPTLLLTTVGRISRSEQTMPANFLQDGDDIYVVGSIAGLDRHPHWALNLEAKPKAWIQIKADRYEVDVKRLTGSDREVVWPKLTEYFPLWGHFQKYCDREFMVFKLNRKAS